MARRVGGRRSAMSSTSSRSDHRRGRALPLQCWHQCRYGHRRDASAADGGVMAALTESRHPVKFSSQRLADRNDREDASRGGDALSNVTCSGVKAAAWRGQPDRFYSRGDPAPEQFLRIAEHLFRRCRFGGRLDKGAKRASKGAARKIQ
ncbi:hypothetical protein KCP70_05030 [Salmonella enterica subsp. enterica]|nr:hypothetical protein KCP70_05030 [Salmonella enterica subsp. enterica]